MEHHAPLLDDASAVPVGLPPRERSQLHSLVSPALLEKKVSGIAIGCEVQKAMTISLKDTGVLYRQLYPKKYKREEELAKIRRERGYSYMDLIDIFPNKLENYEDLKKYFTEHMHAEDVCHCLEGSRCRYFDVHDNDHKWIVFG